MVAGHRNRDEWAALKSDPTIAAALDVRHRPAGD
jgi:hypothetical protein